MYVFFVVNEGRFRLRLLAPLLALCVAAAPFLCPLPVSAADLYMYGGGGGSGSQILGGGDTGGGGGGAFVGENNGKAGDGGNGQHNGGKIGVGAGAGTPSAQNGANGGAGGAGGTGLGTGASAGGDGTQGQGGSGGSASRNDSGTQSYTTVVLEGGQGGGPSQTAAGPAQGQGGAGGNVTYSAEDVNINGPLTITGGSVNGGFAPSFIPGQSGNASFTASGTVTLLGDAEIKSGSPADPVQNHKGGTASFQANTLIVGDGTGTAKSITVSKNTTAAEFKTSNLDLRDSLNLTLNNTAASDVTIGNLAFKNASAFTVTGTGGMTAAGNLSVYGAGNVYNSPFTFNASNKALTFDLTGATAGSVMLSAPGAALNITGATVAVTDAIPALNLGQSLTLIDKTDGAPINSSFTTSGNVQYGYAFSNPGGSSLTLFHNSVATNGDWTAPSTTYSAASAAGQPVSLTVGGTLYGVSALNLTDSGNNLTVDIGGLDAATNSLALNLDGTTAAGVNIGGGSGLIFANGNSLTVTSANGGTMTGAGNISVTGPGSAYVSPIAWNASGKALSFNLAGVANLNNPALATTGGAGVTLSGATTLAVTNTSGLAPLQLGGRYTLIGSTTGAFASQNLADLTSGAETHGLVANADSSLYIFKNKIATAGDYALTGPASYSAGSGTNESILLDVGGKLTVTGNGLSLAGNGANSATVKAGTLITPGLSLAGADAMADIGTLDMSAGSTALNLDGTTAAGVNIGNVTLNGGNTFTVNSANNGAGTFGNLNVAGAGGTLDGSYVPAFTDVNLAGGSMLTSTANPLNFSAMRVQGQGAGYAGTLNAAGKSLLFELPASLSPGQTMLNVTGNADLTGADIGLTYQSVRPNVAPGQSLTLLSATSLMADQTGLTVQTANGDIYTLLVDSNQLLAMLQKLSPTTPAYDRLKAFAEGRTASLAFVNQGADLILNQGFGSALFATKGPGFQIGAFAAGSGGWSSYNTGSHVDVSGASMLAGLAVGNDVGPGRVTLGVFFEGGWGNYNSYNSFSNYASVDGDGDTSYYGGGVLGRWDFPIGRTGRAAAAQRSEPETGLSGEARASAPQEVEPSVIYIDASARLGRTSVDFNTSDIRYNGNKADFDSDAMYWGAHAGLGYQWSITEKAMLDMSGKFIWTRQGSDTVKVHGDKVRFKDADSLRTRLGGRFNYAVCDYAAPYVGAYWEHEFDGRQKSSVNGVGIGSPALKGDTGVGELGLTIRPVKNSGFSLDLAVQGYTGVRDGVSGSLQLKFEF